MSLLSVSPKPENSGGQQMEAAAYMSEANDTTYLAYPVQANSQSHLQVALYTITLKVSSFVFLIFSR